ncbi:hypothetical protein A3Q56_05996 [Intoshia linei]|uniref:alanine transaminase n=1 Tax=Intoshia linei TaxID=1819745 RepID=A0A177AY22_9BILA|nr:hypothetical protein A3Q56_05996 [Intoshia linei]
MLLSKSFNKINIKRLSTLKKKIMTCKKLAPVGITDKNINENVVKLQYAVRGPIPSRAIEIEKDLKNKKEGKYAFSRTIRANIGDAQAMGQKPFTYVRQMISAISLLSLESNHREALNYLPSDVVLRAKEIVDSMDGKSMGAYTNSTGIARISQNVQTYIHERDAKGHGELSKDIQNILKNQSESISGVVDMDDGFQSEHVFLSAGASAAIRTMLTLLIGSKNVKQSGIMIPVPQYPLYSASIDEYNMKSIPYYLNESNGWSMEIEELERSLEQHKAKCTPRAIVVINPGNPTGNVLTLENLVKIVQFAYKNNLIILSDEVYQYNVYDKNLKFYSMKSVVKELGLPITLASFHSISKGYFGECGLRGGYCELYNASDFTWNMIKKVLSVNLCPSTISQSVIDLLVNPPKKDEISFNQYYNDMDAVLSELKLKAQMVTDKLNEIEGITCNPVKGAMYAFPQIQIPEKAILKAKELKVEPDSLYCMELLENHGVCVVPGSGFLQKPDTYHFRTTILPPKELLTEMLEIIKQFHYEFTKKYA